MTAAISTEQWRARLANRKAMAIDPDALAGSLRRLATLGDRVPARLRCCDT
jgi:hypothetical protein